MIIPTLKACYFEASEDIIIKFKSQALHIIKIKYGGATLQLFLKNNQRSQSLITNP